MQPLCFLKHKQCHALESSIYHALSSSITYNGVDGETFEGKHIKGTEIVMDIGESPRGTDRRYRCRACLWAGFQYVWVFLLLFLGIVLDRRGDPGTVYPQSQLRATEKEGGSGSWKSDGW